MSEFKVRRLDFAILKLSPSTLMGKLELEPISLDTSILIKALAVNRRSNNNHKHSKSPDNLTHRLDGFSSKFYRQNFEDRNAQSSLLTTALKLKSVERKWYNNWRKWSKRYNNSPKTSPTTRLIRQKMFEASSAY